jgi:hypothetical protein
MLLFLDLTYSRFLTDKQTDYHRDVFDLPDAVCNCYFDRVGCFKLVSKRGRDPALTELKVVPSIPGRLPSPSAHFCMKVRRFVENLPTNYRNANETREGHATANKDTSTYLIRHSSAAFVAA